MAANLSLSTGDSPRDAADRLRREQEAAAKAKKILEEAKTKAEQSSEKPTAPTSNDTGTSPKFGTANPPPSPPSRAQAIMKSTSSEPEGIDKGTQKSISNSSDNLANAQRVQTVRIIKNARAIETIRQTIRDKYTPENVNGDIKEFKELKENLDARTKLLVRQVEASELARAGETEKATALLQGNLTLKELNSTKLKQANLNAPRMLAENGSEISDQALITRARSGLQTTINTNRAAITQLEAQKNAIEQRKEELGGIYSQGSLKLMEQSTLLSVQQERLVRETQRLFQAHDRITKLANSGDLSAARDIYEGRRAILASTETPEAEQTAKDLSAREFTRNATEEKSYKETQKAVDSLNKQKDRFGTLEGGVRSNLSDTNHDLKNSGWAASWGGHTKELERTKSTEEIRLTNFQQQKDKIQEARTAADSMVKQGRYQEATKLINMTQTLASKEFQANNTELQSAYSNVNQELDKFHQKFKESSVVVAKNVAIGTVATGAAIALAPATGGMSLTAAGTMIGGGTLSGFAAGTAIDIMNAEVDRNVFGDSASKAYSKTLDQVDDNLRTAFLSALGGGSGIGLAKSLTSKGYSALHSTLGSTAGASLLTSTTSLLEQRVRAEIEFNKSGRTDKDKFMEERDLSPAAMVKSLSINTGSGMLGGLIGLQSGAMKEAAKGMTRQAAIETAEKLSDAGTALAITYLEKGKIDSHQLAETLTQVVIGDKIGSSLARNRPRVQDTKNGWDGIAQPVPRDETKPKIPVTVDSSLPSNIPGQTTVEISPEGIKSGTASINPQTAEALKKGDPIAKKIAREKVAEEEYHANNERPIDPIRPDGTKMSPEEYHLRRAKQELVAESVATSKVKQESGSPVSEAKQAHKEVLKSLIKQKIENAKTDDDYKQALDELQQKGLITDEDMVNFHKNYKDNVNRDPKTDPLKQVSNSSQVIAPPKLSNPQEIQAMTDLTIEQINLAIAQSTATNGSPKDLEATLKSIQVAHKEEITGFHAPQASQQVDHHIRQQMKDLETTRQAVEKIRAKEQARRAQEEQVRIKQQDVNTTLANLQRINPNITPEAAKTLVEAVNRVVKHESNREAVLKALTSDQLTREQADTISKGLKANKEGDTIGTFHELRLQAGLEIAKASGFIRAYAPTETTVNTTSGLDSMGIDAIVQLNSDDYMVIQAKSSNTGVDNNYETQATYTDSAGQKQSISRKGNNAINLSGMSLSDIANEIPVMAQYRTIDIRSAVIIHHSRIGDIRLDSNRPIFTLPPQQMQVLEQAILVY